MKWLKKREEGQALVEFVLVLPILLILLLGMIEFGQIYFSYLLTQSASRDAARYGSVGATDAEIYQIVYDKTEVLNQDNLSITITPEPGSRTRGEQLSVAVNYDADLISPIWSGILPNPFPISVETVMRIE